MVDWLFDEDASEAEVVLPTEASVVCPHCGEVVVIGLDPGGGASQQYTEDCQVCCRSWLVLVSFDNMGGVSVNVDFAE